MTTSYLLTGNIRDLVGVAPKRGIRARIRTNLPEGTPLVDLDAGEVLLSHAQPVDVKADGTFSVSLIATNSTGTNVSGGTLRYEFIAEWRDETGTHSFRTGWFTLTAASNLAAKVGSAETLPSEPSPSATLLDAPTAANIADVDSATRTALDALYSGGGGSWGSITGTLSAQTDLQTALNNKAASSHTHAASGISDSTAVGRAVVTAADAAAARLAIGAAASAASGLPRGDWIRTVAGSGESAEVKAACDYVCDGTADEVQINAALLAVSAGGNTGTKGASGGMAILVGRVFEGADSVKLRTYTTLTSAYGKDACWIRPAATYTPGATRGIVELYDVNTQYTNVHNVSIDGLGRSVSGFRLEMGTGFEWDGYHTINNSYIWNVGQVGLHVVNQSGGRMRGNHFSHLRILNAGSHGVHIAAPDSYYDAIDTGSCGGHGFYVAHANNRLVNCKAWYSDISGFHLDSPGRDNQLSACEAQDNALHGFYVGHARALLSACAADSNGHNGSGTPSAGGDGFHVTANGFNIMGSASDKNEGARGLQQRYGINFATAGIRGFATVTTDNNATASSNGVANLGSGAIANVVEM